MTSRRPASNFEGFLLFLLLAACLVAVSASEKSSEHAASKDDATTEDNSSSQDDSKEKRSREEILFGNQQNKPSGLVDDLMGMSDSASEEEEDDDVKPDNSKSNRVSLVPSKDNKDESTDGETMTASSSDSWYNTVPASSSALQYLANPPTLQSMPSEDFTGSLYDQEDVYRRKRQLLGHPLPLRRRRSLRSSLGQMIQKRGLRMPRRSMRLKRQVDVEDVLSALGSDSYYEDQPQTLLPKFNTFETPEKRHVAGRFNSYPETATPEFRYPFSFQHRDDGVLGQLEDSKPELLLTDDEDTADDIDGLMLLNPNARYIDRSDLGLLPYRTREEESEAFQKWLARHTVPNIFTVSRRSTPTFYPLDYRYIPGYKKRSVFSKGNRMAPSRFSDGDEPSEGADLGKWGHVVQVPEAYASAEDVARLYGLANLMAEEEDEARARRAA